MSYDNNFNGYNYYPNNNFQRPIPNQYIFVNGVDGAKSFQMQPGQTILLMDNDNPIIYMKTSNQLGQTSIRYFKMVETSEDELKGTKDNYVSRNEFDEIKAKIDKLLSKKKESDE